MWFQKSYRRHLCDMHIADWNEEFLAKFSPTDYVENLKQANVRNAMIYFQSHVGLCYFPTQVGRMHAAFQGREDMIKQVVDLCHEAGITVTGYYSLIYNNAEYERHPEWRMVDGEGRSLYNTKDIPAPVCAGDGKYVFRYGLCCPNNMEYRAFIKAQMREMAEYFSVEGMFFDMLFWPHICACESCKARWTREVGGELPMKEDWDDPRWLLHMEKRREWMGEFAHWTADEMKKLLPHISVEHNVAYSALPDGMTANGAEVIDACDYAGGDLYNGLYGQSFACKFYRSITKYQPFEYMFTRASNLGSHTQIKSLDVMRSAVCLTMAHHGANLIIDAINPNGTMDPRVYERIGQVFAESKAYEPYLTGDMIGDVAFYYSLNSKFEPNKDGHANYHGIFNSLEGMIANHVPCAITGAFHDLEEYPVLVAPLLTQEDRRDFERLVEYVRNGGSLYFSGASCAELLKRFFGAEVSGHTQERMTYISPKQSAANAFGDFNESYPLAMAARAPIVKDFDESTEVLATVTLPYTHQDTVRFASIHSNPPGIKTEIPAMLYRAFGKGRVLWSGLPIEGVKAEDHQEVFLALLKNILWLSPTVESDAERDVEITAFQRGDTVQINAVLLNQDKRARKVSDFYISVFSERKPKAVCVCPTGEQIPFRFDGHRIFFEVTDFTIYKMYEIQF